MTRNTATMIELKKLKPNPNNPRTIRDEKFKKLVKSLTNFPEMLMARPIVVNSEMVIIGGNMRYKAAIEAKLGSVPVFIADWDEQAQKEFTIKDNSSAGEWDWEALANEFESEDLKEWGVLPDFAYNPETNPQTQMRDVTDDDVDVRQKQIDDGLSSENTYQVVLCPNCSHEFKIA